MKPCIFKGCATALVTPMHADGSVNYDCLKELVNTQIDRGIDALVACGTTGEKSTLRYEEHLKVIEVTVQSAKGRVPVIAGTGSNDTVYSVELCRDAEALGADALLMVTPYYNKTSQKGLVEHYNYIADRVSKPIILYNVPSRTGVNIKPQTYKELSKLEKIVAVKEASGDISQIAEIKHLCQDDLWIYSGNDDQTIPVLSIGGVGVISVASNILPTAFHDICFEYLKGNTEKSRQIFDFYFGLLKALFLDVNPVPLKTAMNILGQKVGPCRLPLYPMDNQNIEVLKNALKNCNLI
ncbi:MAG: 4-hydroxy-tetrahydrodipicolinate synthase [Clostridia bacterium]|nr:4-hydroxy-tetrahydrodipicolinate synthase [Clostridia bacterium]